MPENHNRELSRFYIVGINYKKSDAAVRGQFAINEDQYRLLLEQAKTQSLSDIFVLSTCNRTEIYAIADSADQLSSLLCSFTSGSKELFDSLSYTKNGTNAIQHIFEVAAGLDSQILGDYEIVGQMKLAVKFAKSHGLIGSFFERLINHVLQSSKVIKNETSLSSGTVSVSFAAVQYIRDNVAGYQNKRILLLGLGKIGRNTCRNLVDYLETKNIVLINRTLSKSVELAKELGLQYAELSDLPEHIQNADIILVATNAETATIVPTHVEAGKPKTIIDLSIPNNVDPNVGLLPQIQLINVDELSRLKDETLLNRQLEVPKAKAIIREQIEEFMDWVRMRQNVPVLMAVKEKLQEIQIHPVFGNVSNGVCTRDNDRIQKVINIMATKMRRENQRGCYYIEAINDFMTTSAN
ncbi:MAG TPA: glutamyl-tRNA reductase [Parasegetibacter sp.]